MFILPDRLFSIFSYFIEEAFSPDPVRVRLFDKYFENDLKHAHLQGIRQNNQFPEYNFDPQVYTPEQLEQGLKRVGWKRTSPKFMTFEKMYQGNHFLIQIKEYFGYYGHYKSVKQQKDETYEKYDKLDKEQKRHMTKQQIREWEDEHKQTDLNKKKFAYEQNLKENKNFYPKDIKEFKDIDWPSYNGPSKSFNNSDKPDQNQYNFIEYNKKVPILSILELTTRFEQHILPKHIERDVDQIIPKEVFNSPATLNIRRGGIGEWSPR